MSKYLGLSLESVMAAGPLETIFVGKSLCMVALMCWFLMLSKEVHHAVDLLRAILSAPRFLRFDKIEPEEVGRAVAPRVFPMGPGTC